MKRALYLGLAVIVLLTAVSSLSYADSKKTWANIGKGLAIYEGVKVLTGREGNIVDDVTGGFQNRKAPQGDDAASYNDGYNAGFKDGYQQGYNAGFKSGVEKPGGSQQ